MEVPAVAQDGGEGGCTKLLLFDYDQTIASVHVYHMLDGYMEDDPFESATTEEEGMRMHAEAQLRIFDELFGAGGTGDIGDVYGGSARVDDLRRFFPTLKGAGGSPGQRDVRTVVVSHGYTETVRKALQRADLLLHFDDVVGVDHPLAAQCQGDKSLIAMQLMRQYGVSSGADAILIDDDYRNLVRTRRHCQTYWVFTRQGLDRHEMATLLAWTRGVCPPAHDTDFENTHDFATHTSRVAPRFSEQRVVSLPQQLGAVLQQLPCLDYMLLNKQGIESLPAAVELCNSVPPSAIVEWPKLVALPERGSRTYHVLYTRRADLQRFLDVVCTALSAAADQLDDGGSAAAELKRHLADAGVAAPPDSDSSVGEGDASPQPGNGAAASSPAAAAVSRDSPLVLRAGLPREKAARLMQDAVGQPTAELEAHGEHIPALVAAAAESGVTVTRLETGTAGGRRTPFVRLSLKR